MAKGGGGGGGGTARTDRRVDNSPRSSWCIKLMFVRGGKRLVMVAKFDANICGVSIDMVDSRTDLRKSGGEVMRF